MDQVLFSEPSFKMQEKLKEMRKAEGVEAAAAAKKSEDMDKAEKLLEKKFGGGKD